MDQASPRELGLERGSGNIRTSLPPRHRRLREEIPHRANFPRKTPEKIAVRSEAGGNVSTSPALSGGWSYPLEWKKPPQVGQATGGGPLPKESAMGGMAALAESART
ncbi:MAG: hypothetical protein KatS3mg076_1396 [Candidatus Binatia bacterium]|nr:MAG: hypothetical protein KatS3mg076_1396 [Candidatus Binatia bacterium]